MSGGSPSKLIEFDGETKSAQDWADEYDMPVSTLFSRLDRGWDLFSAITTPVRGYRSVDRIWDSNDWDIYCGMYSADSGPEFYWDSRPPLVMDEARD